MSGIRDLVQLKMQRELLKAQLIAVEEKRDKIGAVLSKKAKQHGLPSNSETRVKAICDKVTTVHGKTVSEFRRLQETRTASTALFKNAPALKLATTMSQSALPIPAGSDAHRKRVDYVLKSQGDKEIAKRLEAQNRKQRKNSKSQHRGPSIPIPASLFPNRYTRGELPCSVEHGGTGNMN